MKTTKVKEKLVESEHDRLSDALPPGGMVYLDDGRWEAHRADGSWLTFPDRAQAVDWLWELFDESLPNSSRSRFMETIATIRLVARFLHEKKLVAAVDLAHEVLSDSDCVEVVHAILKVQCETTVRRDVSAFLICLDTIVEDPNWRLAEGLPGLTDDGWHYSLALIRAVGRV